MVIFLFGVGIAALLYFFFSVSRWSSWRPWNRAKLDEGDNFGNHAEQRFLEENHPATMSGPHGGAQVAGTRESNEKGLGYWG